MTNIELTQVIEDHTLWLNSDGKEGYRAILRGANLEGVNMSYANLTYANLEGANLRCANLDGANLSYANLDDANLSRANLYGANLKGANLDDTNLNGASGNLKQVKSVFCDTYPVTYTAEVMQIGCQRHKLEEWWDFDDKRILEMDGKKALKWWRTWKPILQQIISASPAAPLLLKKK
jgi:hypothetical protein